MRKRNSTLMVFLMLVITMVLSACSGGTTSSANSGHTKNITAITEVFGDGQKVTAVAIEYDKAIDTSKLLKSTFSVSGRTITKVYANTSAAKASKGTNGKYVIIELSTSDSNATTINQNMGGSAPSNSANAKKSGASSSINSANTKSTGGNMPTPTKKTIKLSIKLLANITTTDGDTYAPDSKTIVNNKVQNLVVDDFKQLVYKDPKTGTTLKYNLYLPKNYDKNKSYPMVMFIHDSSVVSTVTDTTLTQGNGAVVWATPSEQAKHECFVLAPQYSVTTVNDQYETTKDLDVTMDLISSLKVQYNLDKNRIYNTGQSMGGMSSMALDIKYPNVFAASLLVACQWDPTKTAVLAHDNIWAIVSAGDVKAFPGMTACLASAEAAGGKVSRATWDGGVNDGSATDVQKASDVAKMVAENTNIKFSVFKDGTVVPSSTNSNNVSIFNHMHTWQLAYNYEGVRDWLFAQHK